ncbi:RIIB lysis inhibitor [Pseudomonas phage PspYZU05]|uniref:RIIB protector from prophage-induced early lysis n=1 Tax=Pseudomonas phage PspYZU05 TaxID=1983556 RepID=A0A2U7N2M6_9CAUD|nr:RIIB lysis inhibitor [Pseudomonas phage PspYZU05]ASD52160.1 hypothetical protein PspYZU05_208 [Pseudomonas phage PspYZU05]
MKLNPRLKKMAVCMYLYGYKTKVKIARELGISVDTVRRAINEIKVASREDFFVETVLFTIKQMTSLSQYSQLDRKSLINAIGRVDTKDRPKFNQDRLSNIVSMLLCESTDPELESLVMHIKDNYDCRLELIEDVPVAEPVSEKTQEKKKVKWLANQDCVVIMTPNGVTTVQHTHKNYHRIIQLLQLGEFDKAIKMSSVLETITASDEFREGLILIRDNKLFYNSIELKSGIAKRIISDLNDGNDFKFWMPFLNNLMENPESKNINRLFDFLVSSDIEITSDGCFYAWKAVRKDFKDHYTGTIDNSPGKFPTQERDLCCPDDNVLCAPGLHVCSKAYFDNYSYNDSNFIKVKVHPRDVVSIPLEYKDAKMRTCGYHVICEVTREQIQ